jgi:hypothetical protein
MDIHIHIPIKDIKRFKNLCTQKKIALSQC